MTTVHGPTVDSQTRCVHYHLPLDIVAIKFKCCGLFYPCYQCHDEESEHETQVWPELELLAGEKVILCGECKSLLDFQEYTATGNCMSCGAQFNPKCLLHYELYFDLGTH